MLFFFRGAQTKDLMFENQKACIRRCGEFECLEVKLDKEDRKEIDIKNIINKGRAITAILNSDLWNSK